MSDPSLLLFTAVNSKYHQFVLPFIYFAAQFNHNLKFEIIFTDDIPIEIKNGVEYLKKYFPITDILLRKIDTNIIPQKLRFLETPITISDYTYILDIDILICEPILNFHKDRLIDNCYHNVVRTYSANQSLMSGLHFCKTKEWFTKTEKERLNFKKNNINLNDENMLYLITKNSKIYIDESLGKTTESFIKNRPIHGIHISLNRKPFEINAKMCNVISENFKYSFLQHIHSSSFIHLINNFDINFKSILDQLLKFCKLDK